ncbi:MAG: aminopeptidase, partial [Phycisphaerales bacterium]|nr:aminopeptidase [Phycisphaerales bacterium]
MSEMPSGRGMVDRLAGVIVNYSTEVKPGDLVVIHADPMAMPLIEALTEAIVAAGGHPHWHARSEAVEQILVENGNDDQLAYLSPIDKFMMENADVRIAPWAEVNTRSLSSVDSARQAKRVQARRPLMSTLMERFNAGKLRWCGLAFPTQAMAQDAEMSLRQYQQFVYYAGKLHLPDPIAAWKEVYERQEILREWLQGKKELHFFVPPHDGHDGTDLRVNVDGGTFINCHGKENFPDGEVFTGPQGADGHVNYTYPALHDGRAAEGVRLEFKGNRAVNAAARRDEAFLIAMLDQDEGARNMGEIAIGTNYDIKGFSRNTLFDEKIGGTFHAACGAGYPEAGSSNESGLHWDMVCELRPDPATGRPGGTIEADGEVFSRDGEIL